MLEFYIFKLIGIEMMIMWFVLFCFINIKKDFRKNKNYLCFLDKCISEFFIKDKKKLM